MLIDILLKTKFVFINSPKYWSGGRRTCRTAFAGLGLVAKHTIYPLLILLFKPVWVKFWVHLCKQVWIYAWISTKFPNLVQTLKERPKQYVCRNLRKTSQIMIWDENLPYSLRTRFITRAKCAQNSVFINKTRQMNVNIMDVMHADTNETKINKTTVSWDTTKLGIQLQHFLTQARKLISNFWSVITLQDFILERQAAELV